MIRHDDRAVELLYRHFGTTPDPALGLGVFHGNEIVGAIVYSNFQWERGNLVDCEVAMVMERPQSFTRSVASMILDYPFLGLKTERLTARVNVDNHRSLKLVRWLGFEIEGHIHRGKYTDHILFGMTRERHERTIQ